MSTHIAIVDALERSDVEGAREAMRHHLSEMEQGRLRWRPRPRGSEITRESWRVLVLPRSFDAAVSV